MDPEDSEQYLADDSGPSLDDSARNIESIEPQIEESDEDEITAEKALQGLEDAWLNEKFAPELLPHRMELVDCMMEQIMHMENNLKRLQKGDIRINIHTMEVSRIRFIISSYLRKRLDKIEEYAIYLLAEDAKRQPEEAFMTPSETQFAREYIRSIESLFNSLALQHMPPRMNNFDFNQMSLKPNMDKHVFIRANKTNKGILIPGVEDVVDFEEGSQHIIQYSAVAHLVKNGDVQLI